MHRSIAALETDKNRVQRTRNKEQETKKETRNKEQETKNNGQEQRTRTENFVSINFLPSSLAVQMAFSLPGK